MSWPSWTGALGPRDRSLWRCLAFLPLWVAMAAIPVFIAYVLAAIGGGGIDAGFTMMAGQLDFVSLVRNRMQGIATWGRDLGVLSAALPEFAAKLVALAAFLLIAKRLYGRPMKSWITSVRKFRWRHLMIGLIVTSLMMSLIFALWGYSSRPGYDPAFLNGPPIKVAIAAGGLFLIVALNAAGEEVLFRGWLLQQTAAFTRRLPLILGVSTVAFALAHRELDGTRLAQLVAGGLGFAWAAWRLGGLELAIGAHTGFNLAISTFLPPSLYNASAKELTDMGLPLEHAGRVFLQEAFSPMDWAVMVFAALVPLIVAEAVARWPHRLSAPSHGSKTLTPTS